MEMGNFAKDIFKKCRAILNKFARPIFPKRTECVRIGKMGEGIAVKFLKGKGMRVLARNYRHGHDEIDVVALEEKILVFVEVKTRAASNLVPGYYAAVSGRKRAAIKRCARAYLSSLRVKPAMVRYDVVEVDLPKGSEAKLDGKSAVVRHYAGACELGIF